MSVTHLTSKAQLNQVLSESKRKLSVIDFHATWCGPCHTIAPTFEALSKQYKDINFLKCDVDAAQDVAALYSVSAMPTFVILKGSAEVDRVRGANRTALEDALRKHSSGSSSSSAFTGKGQTLGGSSATANASPRIDISSAANGITNLDPQVKVFLALIGAYILFWYISS